MMNERMWVLYSDCYDPVHYYLSSTWNISRANALLVIFLPIMIESPQISSLQNDKSFD